ncbi:zinc-dependent peptidase [Larsenimonas salina]|uniref:M90 family metallopeptidase n=1 Tax=Larsenimonas salina TaxID=1295565 RepID=UPI0020737CE3|nr:M90 family metallopeptidase [Larsenimonas salina]MCM5705413.1 M90 family metallopeptidase [Larsenimonas salina]
MSWLDRLRGRRPRDAQPPVDLWQHTLARVPIAHGLADESRERLAGRAWALMHRLRITSPVELPWSEAQALKLTTQVALMTLEWDKGFWPDVREVVVVPGPFRRHLVEEDEMGVVHELDDERIGETFDHGPIVLSLEDVTSSGDWTGLNVIIHEFSHKLDMQHNGQADGRPPLPATISPAEWYRVFTSVWNDLQEHLERDDVTPIDEYAATHPGECFAVCCEMFFTAPNQLSRVYPELYSLLTRYFNQDALARMPDRGLDSTRL